MCARNALLGITGLLLLRVVRLVSFSSLAYISQAFLACHHSACWPTSYTCYLSDLLLLVGLPLVHVACLPLFFTLTYFS